MLIEITRDELIILAEGSRVVNPGRINKLINENYAISIHTADGFGMIRSLLI